MSHERVRQRVAELGRGAAGVLVKLSGEGAWACTMLPEVWAAPIEGHVEDALGRPADLPADARWVRLTGWGAAEARWLRVDRGRDLATLEDDVREACARWRMGRELDPALLPPSSSPAGAPMPPKKPTPAAGNVATPPVRMTQAELVQVADLTLDPKLQCRVAVSQETVEQYATSMRDGAKFPPVDVLRLAGDDGVERMVVVDGWHRVLAARAAGLATISALVAPGTPRDALLAAVRANASHGLQRTQADRRRAVVALLKDAELCDLSSREIAGLAVVSHTYVDQLRRAYAVKRGEVLTEERRCVVDGELSPAWQAIMQDVPHYAKREAERLRVAVDVRALARAQRLAGWTFGDSLKRAAALRRIELATGPWPWPEDADDAARADRVATMDNVEDLVRAAGAPGDHLEEVYSVLVELDEDFDRLATYGLSRRVEAWARRPALLAAAQARLAELLEAAARRPPDRWEVRRAIELAPDGATQSERMAAAPDSVVLEIAMGRLDEIRPEVRDGVFRDRIDPEAPPCPVPWCGGWLLPAVRHVRAERQCVRCRRTAQTWDTERGRVRDTAAQLLDHAAGVIPLRGVVIDAATVDLLRALRSGAKLTPALLRGWVESQDELDAQLAEEAERARLAAEADAQRQRLEAEVKAEHDRTEDDDEEGDAGADEDDVDDLPDDEEALEDDDEADLPAVAHG